MAKLPPKATTAKRKGSSRRAAPSKPATVRISSRATVKAPKKAADIASAQRKDSKQATVLGMLAREDGTTIEAITKTTHWQPHSVRGFFAGVVRKKLSLNLTSERVDGVRIYRIPSQQAAGEAART